VPRSIARVAVQTLSFGSTKRRRASLLENSMLMKGRSTRRSSHDHFANDFSPLAFSHARAIATSSIARGTTRIPFMSPEIRPPGSMRTLLIPTQHRWSTILERLNREAEHVHGNHHILYGISQLDILCLTSWIAPIYKDAAPNPCAIAAVLLPPKGSLSL
jgi:hypothetical protein